MGEDATSGVAGTGPASRSGASRSGPAVAASLLVVAALVVVAVWSWSRLVEGEREHVRGYTDGLTLSVARALDAHASDGRVEAQAAREVLERARRHASLVFAALVVGGRVHAAVGPLPADLAAPPAAERNDPGAFVVWRSTAALRAPRIPPPGARPRGPPPPRASELVGPGARLRPPSGPADEPVAVRGTLVFGYPAHLGGGPWRLVIDLGVRLGLAVLAGVGLTLAFALGRASRRHAAALAAERVRSQSLAELGVTAAGLAHETKNPLGIIVGLAQQISRDPSLPVEHRARVDQIIDAADRAASRLGDFIHYARLRHPAPVPIDLRRVVSGVASVLEPDLQAAQLQLEQDVRVGAVVADEEMTVQVLLNLLLNAIQASAPGRRIVVRAEEQGGRARLEVEDQGKGIPPELLPRVFEPYVTGRPDGHGLGLAIVRRLVHLHGWTIELRSEPGRGTSVWIDGIGLADAQGAP